MLKHSAISPPLVPERDSLDGDTLVRGAMAIMHVQPENCYCDSGACFPGGGWQQNCWV